MLPAAGEAQLPGLARRQLLAGERHHPVAEDGDLVDAFFAAHDPAEGPLVDAPLTSSPVARDPVDAGDHFGAVGQRYRQRVDVAESGKA